MSSYFKEQDEKLKESFMGSKDVEVLRVPKYSCWNCYKLWEKDYLTVQDKTFCSIGCFSKFQELFMVR